MPRFRRIEGRRAGNAWNTARPLLLEWVRRSLKRSAWRGTSWSAVSVHAIKAHPHSVMDHFLELGLLLRSQRLVKGRHGLGMGRNLLCHEISNGVGILLDGRCVIVLYRQSQVLMRRAHLVMGCFLVIHNLG